MFYKDHFNEADEYELQKQLQSINEPIADKDIVYILPERMHLIDILGDIDDNLCYKPLFSVGRSVGALSLGNKSMADLIGILGSKSSVAQNRIPSQRLLLRLTTEELS